VFSIHYVAKSWISSVEVSCCSLLKIFRVSIEPNVGKLVGVCAHGQNMAECPPEAKIKSLNCSSKTWVAFGIEDYLKTRYIMTPAVCAVSDMWCSDSLRVGRSGGRIRME